MSYSPLFDLKNKTVSEDTIFFKTKCLPLKIRSTKSSTLKNSFTLQNTNCPKNHNVFLNEN